MPPDVVAGGVDIDRNAVAVVSRGAGAQRACPLWLGRACRSRGRTAFLTSVVSQSRWWRHLPVSDTHPTGGCNGHGDHAINQITDTAGFALLSGETGFDPVEQRLRTNARATIETARV